MSQVSSPVGQRVTFPVARLSPNRRESAAAFHVHSYCHPRLKELPPTAFYRLEGDERASVLSAIDDWNNEIEVIESSKAPLLFANGVAIPAPPLRWQRATLYHHIAAYLTQQYYDRGFAIEPFYSGGGVLKRILGPDLYPKLCDTDVRVFLTGLPDTALYAVIAAVKQFIFDSLVAHFAWDPAYISPDWIANYLPEEKIRVVNYPEKGLYLVTIVIGEDDWVFIVETGRMHTVTGKGILCPMFRGDMLISLEGSYCDALEAVKMGVIHTEQPLLLHGKGPFVLLDLMISGWMPSEPAVYNSLLHLIATTCASHKTLFFDYCHDHRAGDVIAITSLLMTGYLGILSATHISQEVRERALVNIADLLSVHLEDPRTREVIGSSLPFLLAAAERIATCRHDHKAFCALLLFFVDLYPEPSFFQGGPIRTSIPGEGPALYRRNQYAYLLLPRKEIPSEGSAIRLPDRCYLAFTCDSTAPWRLLQESGEDGGTLWQTLTRCLNHKSVKAMREAMSAGDYAGLIRPLLPPSFDVMEFFTILSPPNDVRHLMRNLIVELSASFKAYAPSINETRPRLHIELKILTLQILLGGKVEQRGALTRLIALLGQYPLPGVERSEYLLSFYVHLFGLAKRGHDNFPNLSELKHGLSIVDYLLSYYRSCYGAIATEKVPVLHYVGIFQRYPEVFSGIAPRLLASLIDNPKDHTLFEQLWDALPMNDTEAILRQITTPRGLAKLGSCLLKGDATYSLERLSRAIIALIASPDNAALAPLVKGVLERLLMEKSEESLSYARELYTYASSAKILEQASRLSFFTKIASGADSGDITLSHSWLISHATALIRSVGNKGEVMATGACRAFCRFMITFYSSYNEGVTPSSWEERVVFPFLVALGEAPLALRLYKEFVEGGSAPQVKAEVSYYLMALWLQGKGSDTLELAFFVLEISRPLRELYRKYLDASILLFSQWIGKIDNIPEGVQEALCSILNQTTSRDAKIAACDKLLSSNRLAVGVWPYLSHWLKGCDPSHFQTGKGLELRVVISCFCDRIAQGAADCLPIEDRAMWCTRAISWLLTEDKDAMCRWLFSLLREYLKQPLPLEIALTGYVASAVSQGSRKGLFSIATLSAMDLEVVIETYLSLFANNIVIADVERSLDAMDRLILPTNISNKRKALRQCWAEYARQIRYAKPIKNASQRLMALRTHGDLTSEHVAYLHLSYAFNSLITDKGKLQPMKHLQEGNALLHEYLASVEFLTDEATEQMHILLNLLGQEPDGTPAAQIGWKLVSHPKVRQALGDKSWERYMRVFIAAYGKTSLEARHEIFEVMHTMLEREPLAGLLPVFVDWIVVSASYSDLLFITSFYLVCRRLSSLDQVAILLDSQEKRDILVTAFCQISTNVLEGRWSQRAIDIAKEPFFQLATAHGYDFERQGDGCSSEQIAAIACADLALEYLKYKNQANGLESKNAANIRTKPQERKKLISMVIIALIRSRDPLALENAFELLKRDIYPTFDATKGRDMALMEAAFEICASMSRPAVITAEVIGLRFALQDSFGPMMSRDIGQAKWLDLPSTVALHFSELYLSELERSMDFISLPERVISKNALKIIACNFLFLLPQKQKWKVDEARCLVLWQRVFITCLRLPERSRDLFSIGSRVFIDGVRSLDVPHNMPLDAIPILALCEQAQRVLQLPPDAKEEIRTFKNIPEMWALTCYDFMRYHKLKTLPDAMVDVLSQVLVDITTDKVKCGNVIYALISMSLENQIKRILKSTGGTLAPGFLLLKAGQQIHIQQVKDSVTLSTGKELMEMLCNLLTQIWGIALEELQGEIEVCKSWTREIFSFVRAAMPPHIAGPMLSGVLRSLHLHPWAKKGGEGALWMVEMGDLIKKEICFITSNGEVIGKAGALN